MIEGKFPLPRFDEVVGDLPRRCGREHREVWVNADPQRVLVHKIERKTVVGRHARRLATEVNGARRKRRGQLDSRRTHGGRKAREPPIDALGELVRRFLRERQSKHVARFDKAVCNQPYDSRRHRLGFAASRAGNDERGGERRFNDGHLFRRRLGLAEKARHLARAQAHFRHISS